jgi:hypothetical protein
MSNDQFDVLGAARAALTAHAAVAAAKHAAATEASVDRGRT